MHGGDFHGPGDGGRANIQRPAEYEGKTQDIVDLIGIVAAAGGDDGVATHRSHLLRQDFRSGIRQREDQRPGGHFRDHGLREHPAGG